MNGVTYTGIPSEKELDDAPGYPFPERVEKGPVAVIECVQEIPCNPCERACSQNAISVGHPITNLPNIDSEKCIGCGLCISSCPGLAIFMVHKNYTDTTCLVEFPYEFLPLPVEGSPAPLGGRDGGFLTWGKIVKIKKTKHNDGTTVIVAEAPKEFCMEIRTICRKGDYHGR